MLETNLPPPLVPAHVDLRDFGFMPLDVSRLRDSDLSVEATGDEFRAAILLWCAAWHQVPAGSLPDNDARLSQFAGYGRVISAWLEVKAGALRGFVKCADGRIYHPVIAEKALEAWDKKQAHAERKEADRLRKAKRDTERGGNSGGEPEKSAQNSTEPPTEFQRNANGIPAENALKGQGQGQERTVVDAGATSPDRNLPTSENPAPPPATPPPEHIRVGRLVGDAMGVSDDPRWFGDFSRVKAWLDQGGDEALILGVVGRVMAQRGGQGPPKSLKYFDQAIADAIKARTAPLPEPAHDTRHLPRQQQRSTGGGWAAAAVEIAQSGA